MFDRATLIFRQLTLATVDWLNPKTVRKLAKTFVVDAVSVIDGANTDGAASFVFGQSTTRLEK